MHRVVLPLTALAFLILYALVPKTEGFQPQTGSSVSLAFISEAKPGCLLYVLAAETGVIGSGYAPKEISSKSMDVPSSTVILMDDSFSMNADGGFETAGSFAEGFLNKLKKGSEATVVRMGGSASPVFDKPTSETKTLGQRSGQLRAASDRVDLAGSFDTGIGATHDGQNAKREIILISDFRKADWERSGRSLAGLRERLENRNLKPAAITFIDAGGNLPRERLRRKHRFVRLIGRRRPKVLIKPSFETMVRGPPTREICQSGYSSTKQSSPFRKPWFPSHPVKPAGSLPHKFSEAGSSTVTVEIGARDALDSDNRRSSSIAVLDRIGVLLVDGAPSEEWLQGETDFLKIALTPFEEARQRRAFKRKI